MRKRGTSTAKPSARGGARQLADLLTNARSVRWTGGVKCATCERKDAAQINADVRAYALARKAGNPMPLSAFVREWLAKTYSYPLSNEALRKHMRRCMEIDGL